MSADGNTSIAFALYCLCRVIVLFKDPSIVKIAECRW